jgi:energy-coupling factor transporter transmembrane protein EcfT
MAKKPTSKIFLGSALILLLVGLVIWGLFRSPERNTGIFGLLGLNTGSEQSEIPHGHGQDTLVNRLADPDHAPRGSSSCDLFDTSIMDDDCDGIPNWLEDRIKSDAQDSNNPYLQGGWDHDGDGVFHGMDGHYACATYGLKLLNCDKLKTSFLESVTSTQDTDQGGVPDVMEIIRDMNPLEPCDDRDACDDSFITTNPIPTDNTSTNNTSPTKPHNPKWDDYDEELEILFNEIEDNVNLLQQYAEVETGKDINPQFSSVTYLQELTQGLQTQYTTIRNNLLDISEAVEAGYEGVDLDLQIQTFEKDFRDFTAQVFACSQEVNQFVTYVPLEDFRNRHNVRLYIDTEASTWQEGNVALRGYVDTFGIPLRMDMRFYEVWQVPYVDEFYKFCTQFSRLSFQQTNVENNTNIGDWILDILNVFNTAGQYRREPLLFDMGTDPRGDAHYTEVVQTEPGQLVPFVATVEGLKPRGLYAFAVVDPTFQIPLNLGDLLGIPVTLDIGAVNTTGSVSSFMFGGPSCFDILNRYTPIVTVDTATSVMVGGTDYAEEEVSRRTTPIHDGSVDIFGTLSLSQSYRPDPLLQNLGNEVVKVPLVFEQTSATANHDGSHKTTSFSFEFPVQLGQTAPWDIHLDNVHQDDMLTIRNPVTNEPLLGPVAFSEIVKNDGLLGSFEEMWYFVVDFNPYQPSRLYGTKDQCLAGGLRMFGKPTPCYALPVPYPDISIAIPFQTFVAEYANDILTRPTESFITPTKAYLAGTVHTHGHVLNLEVQYYEAETVGDNGNIIPFFEKDPFDLARFTQADVKTIRLGRFQNTLNFDNPGEHTQNISWEFTGLQPGKRYYYRIIDADIMKNLGYAFTELWIDTPTDDLILAPEAGTVDGGQLVLDANAVAVGIQAGFDVESPSYEDVDPTDTNFLFNPLDTVGVDSVPKAIEHGFRVFARILVYILAGLVVYIGISFFTSSGDSKKLANTWERLRYIILGTGLFCVALVIGLATQSVIQCFAQGIC